MAFRRDRETVKKEPVVKPVVEKVEKIKKEKKEVKKDVVKAVPIPEKNEKNKNSWHGIGIIGMNPDIQLFKSKIKLKNLKLGEVIMNFIIDWNKKN